jgi:Mrp family chromosome partitioning ATPase
VLYSIHLFNQNMASSTEDVNMEAPPNANEGCVGPSSETAGKASACEGCPNKAACSSGAFSSPEAIAKAQEEAATLQRSLENVSHVILILSGKGGVGKSTMAAQLSHAMASRGYAVGLLDVDLCGPSAPRMVGVSHQGAVVHRSGSGAWTPVYANPNLAVMSISFLLGDTNQAVIWRGPRKNALIQQFLTETDWTGDTGGLDYLIVDTPPGTSDEHISTVQYLQKANAVSGAVVVTTPEEVSLADVRKELNFCEKTKVPILGVVENMSSYQIKVSDLKFLNTNGDDETAQVLASLKEKCPEVLEMVSASNIFPTTGSGAKGMADQYKVPYWGKLPMDSDLLKACDEGKSFVDTCPDSLAAKALNGFVDRIIKSLPVEEAHME